MLDRFPIDELLERLRAAGFEVSVADYLRLFRLIEIIGETAARDELRISLRPLFTSSEEEQQRFDDVFRSVGSGAPPHEPPNLFINRGFAVRAHDRAARKVSGLSGRTWMLLASACVVAAILALAAWQYGWFANTAITPPTDTGTTTASTTSTGSAVPTPQEPSISWALLGAFMTFLLAFGVLADTGRWAWRRFASRGIAGRRPPFEFHRPPDSDAAIFESQSIQQAATTLRGRLAGERWEVDLRRTIRATVDGGGFPNLHYFGSAQSPEYLALIDRRSPDDHLATYFELLVDQLATCGAAIDRYRFDSDPRVCTARDGTMVDVGQLRAARPTAKLLLFTDAAGLLDARTGAMHSWVERDLNWDQRVLLVPAIPQQARLVRLSAHFAVERADSAGLLRMAQRFASATVTHATPASDATVAEAPSLAQLQRVLSAGVFRWLTACAVQRSLEWNATLAIGRVAYPGSTEKELLELVRLGWFRHGSIPEALRQELLAILTEDRSLARAARKAVAEELRRRSTEAPRGSFASEILLVEAVAHDLAASEVIDTSVTDELRRVDPALIRRDDDLPRLLAPDHTTPPGRWSRLRFRGGFRALGPSAVAYTVLMAAFAALVAVGGGVGEVAQEQKAAETATADTSATDTESPEPDPDITMPSRAPSNSGSSSTTSTTVPAPPVLQPKSPSGLTEKSSLMITFDVPEGEHRMGDSLRFSDVPYQLTNGTKFVKGASSKPVELTPGQWLLTASVQDFLPVRKTIKVVPGSNAPILVILRQDQSPQTAVSIPTPRTSFAWDSTEDISNTWLATEWIRQSGGVWQQMQEYRGNVDTPEEIAHQTSTWRETGRATVDGTTGVIVREAKSSREVFIPDLKGGKNPSVVRIRANSKAAWRTLVDLSVDHRL